MIEDHRDLLARVAVHNPHLAGAALRMCNELADAPDTGQIPPPALLIEFGEFLARLGGFLTDVASQANASVVIGSER